jgi:hypothetical protein
MLKIKSLSAFAAKHPVKMTYLLGLLLFASETFHPVAVFGGGLIALALGWGFAAAIKGAD